MVELVYTPLTEMPVGESVELRRVETGQADRLRYFAEHGLVPGAAVVVTGRQPFGGPVTVRTSAGEQLLGAELAGLLLCARVEAR